MFVDFVIVLSLTVDQKVIIMKNALANKLVLPTTVFPM